jgi:hypothetical protein
MAATLAAEARPSFANRPDQRKQVKSPYPTLTGIVTYQSNWQSEVPDFHRDLEEWQCVFGI